MDDDKNDEFSFPFGSFGFGGMGAFFGDMNRQMKEMSRLMDEIFNHSGEMHPGFYPQDMRGRGSPMYEDPRSSMLKNPDTPHNPTANPQTLPPNQQPSMNLTPWSSQDTKFFPSSDSFITGKMRSVSTIRRSDGSVERVEKITENGQTCTTVTKTDPDGNSTSTTTCDRPAIDAGPSLIKSDDQFKPPVQTDKPEPTSPKNDLNLPDMPKDDVGFFSKLFGNYGFNKPKS